MKNVSIATASLSAALFLASATAASVVPDLAGPDRWKKTTDGKIIVTPDNFIRAESDVRTPWIRSDALPQRHQAGA